MATSRTLELPMESEFPMARLTRIDYELESKIWEMSNYLDRIVLGEENDCHSGRSPGSLSNANRRTPPLTYIPSLSGPGGSICSTQSPAMPVMTVPGMYPLTNVTSALATRMNTFKSTLRFIEPSHHSRPRKWSNQRQTEKEPDTSDLDINATMAELGLTPESLTTNEVYRLFSTYNKLAFYIHSDFVFTCIYDARTVPNTMNASVQTRHAVWSSNKLLRQLREVLKKYGNVPPQFQSAFAECKQSLEDLHKAILKLETFKFCVLEHRKGKFISQERRENLEPLIDTLNQVIQFVGQSRMYIQVIEWALNKPQEQVEAICSTSCEQPPQPVMDEEVVEAPVRGRPLMPQRYIG